MKLKINYILEKSKVQGPGNRFTIWVQGCSIRCPGCNNKDTWDFNAGKWVDVDQLSTQIIKSNVDGLTLSGGEPLEQFPAVFRLVKKVFEFKNIFLCSGYLFKYIKSNYKEILDFVDIICAGPFDATKICQSQWKGSENQQVIYLTDRGKTIQNLPIYKKEYRINKRTGEIILTGFSV
jgi:anaerobic ribonucleoside-triphosphate reductase activating protein